MYFGVSFALWGGGLVYFSPLPCPRQKEGHVNNPVGKLSSNCGDTDCRRLHFDGSSLSCDGEFIFAV